jgi:tetratricopeptide (TPR) repeat protein
MFLHPIFRKPFEEKMKKITGLLFLVLLLGWTVAATAQDTREQAWLEAVKLNPKDATAHFNLGVAYFNNTKYDQAASEFEKCVQINSKDNQARELLESSRGFSAYSRNQYSPKTQTPIFCWGIATSASKNTRKRKKPSEITRRLFRTIPMP